jgi:hypothetical protein
MILLIYDLLYDNHMASKHLPWIQAGLQYLSRMRAGEPVTNTIAATHHILRKVRPEYVKDLAFIQPGRRFPTGSSGPELPLEYIPDVSTPFNSNSSTLHKMTMRSITTNSLDEPLSFPDESATTDNFSVKELLSCFDIDAFISQMPMPMEF